MATNDPTFACIGGKFANDLLISGRLVGDPLGPKATPFGPSQPIYRCRSSAGDFFLLLRHSAGPKPIASSFVNHRANIYALKELGTTHILSWSASRAISHNYRLGQFAIVDDLIDETRRRTNTFFEQSLMVDLRQWPVFCPWLRSAVSEAMDELEIGCVPRGTYLCSEGPRRETRAEVQKYALFGADLVGHSLAPETFLAKELQICYASLCLVADFAETGSDHRPFGVGCLFDGLGEQDDQRRLTEALEQLPTILEQVLRIVAGSECKCCCQKDLFKSVDGGTIEKDFRTWFTRLTPAHAPAAVARVKAKPMTVPG